MGPRAAATPQVGFAPLPPSRQLYGRKVLDAAGRRLGTLEMVVLKPDGERVAVVRHGVVRRRRLFVSLLGATLERDAIHSMVPPDRALVLYPRHLANGGYR